MKKKYYLIVKCEELNDQYETDADRKPICLVNDWEEWFINNKVDYTFEVYEINDNGECVLIKDYNTPANWGMALYYWNINNNYEQISPTIVHKWPNTDKTASIPEEVWTNIKQDTWDMPLICVPMSEERARFYLKELGYVEWYNHENTENWYYGPYINNKCLYGL